MGGHRIHQKRSERIWEEHQDNLLQGHIQVGQLIKQAVARGPKNAWDGSGVTCCCVPSSPGTMIVAVVIMFCVHF